MIHRLYCYRLTRRVPLVEKDMPTLPEHPSSPPVFSGVRVMRSLVLYVCFVDRCLPLCCLFFFDIRFLIAPLVSSNSSCKIELSVFLFGCFYFFLLLHVYFLYIYNQWNTRIQHQYANKTGQIMLPLTLSAYGPQTLLTTLPSFGLWFFL